MKKIAILLPCYNEEPTIGKVICDFRAVLPDAEIYVYDNNSTDRSAAIAAENGAIVRHVPVQGKGSVVRKMFLDVDADCYLMVDSDDTYPASAAPQLIAPILDGSAEMVIGDRLSTNYFDVNKRPFHSFGNTAVRGMIQFFFHHRIADVMTGYRAFSRLFVKNCPILKNGFELETEMTLFALDRRLTVMEVPIEYRERQAGSISKLHTFRDGFQVIRTVIRAVRQYRPLFFYCMLSMFCFLIAAIFFVPVLIEYYRTGLVPRFPTLICSVAMTLTGFLMMVCGLILNSIKYHFNCLFEQRLHEKK